MVWAKNDRSGCPWRGRGGEESPCHDALSWSLTLLWGSMSCRLGPWPSPGSPHTLDLPPTPGGSNAGRKDKAEGCLATA